MSVSFRKLFSETTAVLVRRFGVRHWEAIEDAVQATLADASVSWNRSMPENPSGWTYRVAYRKLLDTFRRDRALLRAYAEIAKEETVVNALPDLETFRDETLRMLFLCCTPTLSEEARVALALKTIGGLGVRELAAAFLVSEEAIKKRLQRARSILVEEGIELEFAVENELDARLQSVQQVIYLIFNEGYFSTSDSQVIREDLCGEAMRLASLLAHDPRTNTPTANALCSLTLLHAARIDQR